MFVYTSTAAALLCQGCGAKNDTHVAAGARAAQEAEGGETASRGGSVPPVADGPGLPEGAGGNSGYMADGPGMSDESAGDSGYRADGSGDGAGLPEGADGDAGFVPDRAEDGNGAAEMRDDTTVTFMVYLDAASLESGEEPFATYDLEQMMEAQLSENVRVIVQTGGTRRWNCEGISPDSTQRHEVTDAGLVLLEDTGVQMDMTDARTLRDFIVYCAEEAPADRYMLLLWGHGRGPRIGYGLDDFQDFNSAMTLQELAGAVEEATVQSGISIELIGFDVCLMGTLETVYALQDCCGYLAVSEDYEPAYGWQYTQVLNALSENPSIGAEELSQVIVGAYMSEAERSGDRGIMAVVDMRYAGELWQAWELFAQTNAADMDRLIERIWHDESLLTPVPTGTDGYVSDDDAYSLQDYGLTDLAALCELAPGEEADRITALLGQALVAVDSYHMARTMCGLAVCP